MPYEYPAFDGKHEAPALISADHEVEAAAVTPAETPDAVVLCYQPTLFEHAVETHETRELFADHYLFDCHVLADVSVDGAAAPDGDADTDAAPEHDADAGDTPDDDATGSVGVVGNFGIGAPVTAMIVETLGAAGVEAFLSVGYAGCLQTDVSMADVIIPDRAIRDEGTSHHYLAPGELVKPTPSLAADARATTADSTRTVHEGTTWTVDAAYRETVPEVDHYAERGVLTVEMEAAAVFAVARHHRYEAAALLVVSDYLGTEEWEPRFDQTADHLRELFEIARETLVTYLETP
ncbi:nucleoside phosphorylase [Halobaculum sp. MBLA0147]|uniref:nucleoside phosphorylase n=1 Tax=Halobaculum sp. MBLA0147 TaxID=3079934 RepID=UPI00352684A7